MIITSVNNDVVKETAKLLQKKYRETSGLFILEGQKCVEEAINYGLKIEKIFVNQKFSYDFSNINIEIIETTEAVLSKITVAKSAPPVIAVAHRPEYKIDMLSNMNKVLLLEGIKDAGNLGTILRTSIAFNMDGIILYGDTIDLYNPKCVRSAVGNLWKIPVFKVEKLSDIESYFKDFEKIATLPKSENTCMLKDFKSGDKELIMFGSEATGLSDELKQYATRNLTIEMNSKVESLNLGVSVGVVLYTLMK